MKLTILEKEAKKTLISEAKKAALSKNKKARKWGVDTLMELYKERSPRHRRYWPERSKPEEKHHPLLISMQGMDYSFDHENHTKLKYPEYCNACRKEIK